MTSRQAKQRRIRVSSGSGNVFADLGVPDAQGELAKARLAAHIGATIRRLGLTQGEAASRLGVEQPRVSEIVNARLAGFSKDRLIELSLRLGTDVRIILKDAKGRGGRLVVESAPAAE